jgi:acyl carrier protein
MPDELTESVCKIVATVFGAPLEEISAQTTHEDLEEWDSLNLINLMIALESEFGVTLEVDDAAELLSIEKIVAVLRGRGV